MLFSILPKSLLIAVVVQFACQIYKFASHSLKERKLSWRHLVTFGGMPSSHSAFVTSLALAIGVLTGFTSDLFALAVVFGAIVILDAYKLRGNVQKQAIVVNRLQTLHLPEDQRVRVNEMVGHTLPEIVAGMVLGAAVSVPLALWVK